MFPSHFTALEQQKSMKNSNPGFNPDENDSSLGETAPAYDFELPVNRDLPGTPPKGGWEDGWRLSELALEAVRDRPEIFVQRDRRMCSVEFRL
jgi:hypothetical protein